MLRNDEHQIVDYDKLRKMSFIYNALQNGWKIHKKEQYYIFRKKHQHKEEIFDESYLSTFVKENSGFKE